VAVGTYQLDEAAGRRDGNVQLFRVESYNSRRANGDEGGEGDEESDEEDDEGAVEGPGGGSAQSGRRHEALRARLVPCGRLEMPGGGVLDCKASSSLFTLCYEKTWALS
jgi:hypothetical protein